MVKQEEMEHWVQVLQNGDLRVRWSAIRALMADNAQVREAAAEAVKKISGLNVLPLLIEALADSDEMVREAAVLELVTLGDVQLDTFITQIEAIVDLQNICIQILQDKRKNWKGRRNAARVLGKYGDERSIKPLLRAQLNAIRNIREAATEALEELVERLGSSVIGPLQRALSDPDRIVQQAAREALAKLQTQPGEE